MVFIFDLDGVIYRGREPLPCASHTVQWLRNLGHQVYFLTNNSSRTRTYYAEKLASQGISASPSEIVSSSYLTALYLLEQGAAGARVLAIGEEGLRTEMHLARMQLVEPSEDCQADYVVVGIDRGINYLKLLAAQQAILKGATFIATNRDPTYPLEGGKVEPGGGSIVAAIETCSGRKPILIGKPETYGLRKILQMAGATPAEAIMVGDRLDTDILMAKRLNIRSVLTLTGVTSLEELAVAPPDLLPDLVVHHLGEFPERVTPWLT